LQQALVLLLEEVLLHGHGFEPCGQGVRILRTHGNRRGWKAGDAERVQRKGARWRPMADDAIRATIVSILGAARKARVLCGAREI
jgi:hypothetical protein